MTGDAPSPDKSALLLRHAAALAAESGASAVFVYADALPPGGPPVDVGARLVVACRGAEQEQALAERGYQRTVRVPPVTLTRMGQIKVAVLVALSRGLLQPGDRIVCLAGARHDQVDLLLVTEVGTEHEAFVAPSGAELSAPNVTPEVVARVLELAVELAGEGREGKPVGTLFVVGDMERVKPLTRQMILNPFFGYPEDQRNVLGDVLGETLKELAVVDGAFLIRGDGVVEAAGAFLKTSALPEEGLPSGLGARHQAAAGITYVTDCLAVVVSESTGTVSVFRGGKIVAELERVRRAVTRRRGGGQ
ncbi:MAG: DNA integrity scanning protein DisA nucleotide-binding domain protein [Planctomycetota bacterium]